MKRDLILLSLTLGLLLMRFYFYFTRPLPYHDGDEVRITAQVTQEPIKYDDYQYIRIQGLKAYLPPYPQISYGDRVIVEGKVEGDKLKNPKLIQTFPSFNPLYHLRNKLLAFYQSSLPSPHSGLLAGMVIGSKSGINSDFYDKLKNSGTVHVVVASGMNVTLISGFLVSIFTLFFKRKLALILTFLGIWSYAIIAGFDAPIIRAAIMGSIAFLSQESGRVSSAIRALIISGLIMLFVFPAWITDVGFLLSFFATLSLILFGKRMQDFFKFVPSYFREDLATTTAAQIGVAPILLFAFGRFNIFSPVINVLILWTVPLITIIGMIGGMIGLIIPLLGKYILWLSYPLTLWFVEVVELF